MNVLRFGVLLLSAHVVIVTAQQPPAPGAPAAMGVDSAWSSFSALINDYVKLRERISEELPPLTVTTKPAEIAAKSDAIAQAVQRANPKPAQGRFFSAETAAEIRRRISEYGKLHDLSFIVAPDADERETVRGVAVYTRFPVDSVMQTMPPGLLQRLPPLPPMLEYRLLGRVLILRDSDAAMVLDYLPNAISVVK